jgi:uncharacterized protein
MDYQQPQNIDSGKFITGSPTPTSDERTWGLLAHLSGLVTSLLCFGLSFLGPLLVMAIKGKESSWVNEQAKEALNFQITATGAVILSAISMACLVGFLLLPVVAIGTLVLTVIGALKANEGVMYRYPFALRLIK